MNLKIEQLIKIWIVIGITIISMIVIVGGITRLTESGLSMVNWRLFMGSLPPMTEQAWQETFEQYKQYPQYQEVNFNFSLGQFKSIFWWEFIHRVLGRLLGIIFIIPFLFFLYKKALSKKLITHLLIVFALGAFQAFLGWYMVKSGLSNIPRVSHYRLAAHLITALATISVLFWIYLKHFTVKSFVNIKINKYLKSFLALLGVQLVYGAFVAGMDAGFIHNHFPLMEKGQFIAESSFIMDPFIINFIENKSGIQLIHRLLAYSIVVFAFLILMKLKKEYSAIPKGFMLFGAIVLLQVLLGILTLLMRVPVSLGVAHQFGALLLLLTTVYLLYNTSRNPSN